MCLNNRIPYPTLRSSWDLPSSQRFFSCMPGAQTPTDPRESHHVPTLGRCLCSLFAAWFPGSATLSRPSSGANDSSVLASSFSTLSPSALLIFDEAVITSGWCGHPLAYKILYVRFTTFVHDSPSLLTKASLSASGATLDTGGWLTLTRPGLTPSKKRKA
jgi:hypothetical protein